MGSQSGKIRAAKLDSSPRLQRVLTLLQDGRWHGTRDILVRADARSTRRSPNCATTGSRLRAAVSVAAATSTNW